MYDAILSIFNSKKNIKRLSHTDRTKYRIAYSKAKSCNRSGNTRGAARYYQEALSIIIKALIKPRYFTPYFVRDNVSVGGMNSPFSMEHYSTSVKEELLNKKYSNITCIIASNSDMNTPHPSNIHYNNLKFFPPQPTYSDIETSSEELSNNTVVIHEDLINYTAEDPNKKGIGIDIDINPLVQTMKNMKNPYYIPILDPINNNITLQSAILSPLPSTPQTPVTRLESSFKASEKTKWQHTPPQHKKYHSLLHIDPKKSKHIQNSSLTINDMKKSKKFGFLSYASEGIADKIHILSNNSHGGIQLNFNDQKLPIAPKNKFENKTITSSSKSQFKKMQVQKNAISMDSKHNANETLIQKKSKNIPPAHLSTKSIEIIKLTNKQSIAIIKAYKEGSKIYNQFNGYLGKKFRTTNKQNQLMVLNFNTKLKALKNLQNNEWSNISVNGKISLIQNMSSAIKEIGIMINTSLHNKRKFSIIPAELAFIIPSQIKS